MSKLPDTWASHTIFLDNYPVEFAYQDLIQQLNQGPTLVNFIGHSGPTAWTFNGLFDDDDAASLTNIHPSIVMQWGCWNTYHVFPTYDTLSHRFLLSGPRGAAAVIGAATLTTQASD